GRRGVAARRRLPVGEVAEVEEEAGAGLAEVGERGGGGLAGAHVAGGAEGERRGGAVDGGLDPGRHGQCQPAADNGESGEEADESGAQRLTRTSPRTRWDGRA